MLPPNTVLGRSQGSSGPPEALTLVGLTAAGGVLSVTSAGGGGSTPGVTVIYTASGAIDPTCGVALINSASAVAMTLGSGFADSHQLRIERYGVGAVTVTANVNGSATTITMNSAAGFESVTLQWSLALSTWTVAVPNTAVAISGGAYGASLAARFGLALDPYLDFEATGNGSTDDLAQVSAAITAVNASSTINVLQISRPHYISNATSLPALAAGKFVRFVPGGTMSWQFGTITNIVQVDQGNFLTMPTLATLGNANVGFTVQASAFAISSGGTGYVVGDVVTVPLMGFTPSAAGVEVIVTSVNPNNGAIYQVQMYTGGFFTAVGTVPQTVASTGGTGTGAQITLQRVSVATNGFLVYSGGTYATNTPPTVQTSGGTAEWQMIAQPVGLRWTVNGTIIADPEQQCFIGYPGIAGTPQNEYLSACWFGAKSGQDSTVAIQCALLTGLDVHVPQGTFNMSGTLPIITSNQRLFGAGRYRTTLYWTTMPQFTVRGCIHAGTFAGGANYSIEDLWISCAQPNVSTLNALTQFPAAIHCGAWEPTANALNCRFRRLTITQFINGIYGEGGLDTTHIEDVEHACFGYGIAILQSHDIVIIRDCRKINIGVQSAQTAIFGAATSVGVYAELAEFLQIFGGYIACGTHVQTRTPSKPLYNPNDTASLWFFGTEFDLSVLVIDQQYGDIHLIGCPIDQWAWNPGTLINNVGMASHQGGNLYIEGCLIATDPGTATQTTISSTAGAGTTVSVTNTVFQPFIRQSTTQDTITSIKVSGGASAVIQGNQFLRDPTSAITNGIVQITSSSDITFNGNKTTKPTSGSGALLNCTADVSGTIVTGNMPQTRAITVTNPTGTGKYVGSNGS